MALTRASPATIASSVHPSGRSAMHGQRLPSTRTWVGATGSASSARRIASNVAWRMLRLSISSRSAQPTAQASERARMRGASRARSAPTGPWSRRGRGCGAADPGSPPPRPPGLRAARDRPRRRRRRAPDYSPAARASARRPRPQGAARHSRIASAARAAPPRRSVRWMAVNSAAVRARGADPRARSAAPRRAPAPSPAPARTRAPGGARRAGSAAKSIAP